MSLSEAELSIPAASPEDPPRSRAGLARRLPLGRTQAKVLCVGGANMDLTMTLAAPARSTTSNPGEATCSVGGVARNVAENLARLGQPTRLASAVGDDEAGRRLLAHCRAAGIDTSLVQIRRGALTGSYVAIVNPDGELSIGASSMSVLDGLDGNFIHGLTRVIEAAPLVFADTNLPIESLHRIVAGCRAADIRLAVDTVSMDKARRLPEQLDGIAVLFCNRGEAIALLDDRRSADEPLDGAPADLVRALCEQGVGAAVMTDPTGVWYGDGTRTGQVPATAAAALDVTGAGDAMIAGTLYGLLCRLPLSESCGVGQRAAGLTVMVRNACHPGLSPLAIGAPTLSLTDADAT